MTITDPDEITATIQRFLASAPTRFYEDVRWRLPQPDLRCANNATISIQAGLSRECSPQSDTGPWHEVEVMFAFDGDFPGINAHRLRNRKSFRVPLDVVVADIVRNGGLIHPPMGTAKYVTWTP